MTENLEGKFVCSKCGHRECETGEMRASGSALASAFDLEGRRFSSVTCTRCEFTEFYRVDRKRLTEISDFFVS